MATAFFFLQNAAPFVRIETEGYTVSKPVAKTVGFIRISGFEVGLPVFEADEWDREQGAVAMLGVTPNKQQFNPLFETRAITFLGKSVIRWVDGNGVEQKGRILSYDPAPEAFYPTFVTRNMWKVEEGKEVQL